jgi:hypothetical protein
LPSISTSAIIDDLDDHLAGRHRLDHFAADGLFLHVLDELADHFKRHVGFDQRAADLAHGGVDVSLGECAPAGQLVEDATEAVLKCFEHSFFSLSETTSIGLVLSSSPLGNISSRRMAKADWHPRAIIADGCGLLTSRAQNPCVSKPANSIWLTD